MNINQHILDEWVDSHKQRSEELSEDKTSCPPEYHSNTEKHDGQTQTDNEGGEFYS